MIVHLVTDRFSYGGGMEHIFQIVNGIKNVYFRIFAMPESGYQPGKHNGIKEKFKTLENVEFENRGFDPALVLQGKPDLIHIHHLKPLLRFYQKPFVRYPIPIVFTAHGLHLHKYEFHLQPVLDAVWNKAKYSFRFHLEKWLFSKADRVIAVSREDLDFMRLKYRLKNAIYLTNGIGSITGDWLKFTRNHLRKLLELPGDCFLFVTVARFDFQKGYDFLLKTIFFIKGFLESRKIKFVLVGDGPELPRMKKLSDKLGISKFIIFLGERPDGIMLMKAGDVFLLPSRWEGLPIVLLECGRLRVPVIASNTYGNREIIGKKNGILFPNLDQSGLAGVIQKSATNGFDYVKLTENLYQEVCRNYSLEKMLAGLKMIYGLH